MVYIPGTRLDDLQHDALSAAMHSRNHYDHTVAQLEARFARLKRYITQF
jgi:hypothetical protein